MKKTSEKIIIVFLFIVIFGVYLSTMFSSYKGNDSPETAAAALILGIMHPPGYPLMTMTGKIASALPLANPAFRINVFSALLAVAVVIFMYLILIRHVFACYKSELSFRLLAAGFAFVLAFSGYFWPQALEAKGGIYNLNLFFLSVIFLAMLEAIKNNEVKFIYLSAYIYGLSLSNHWPSMIVLLPLFIWVIYGIKPALSCKKLFMSSAFTVLGLSAYMFLYVRAGTSPDINWGDPGTIGRLISVITRESYRGEIKPFTAFVLGYHLKYFGVWFVSNYGFLWMLLPFGAVFMYKDNKPAFFMTAGTALILSFVLVFLNRTALETIWLMGIFLMPAALSVLIIIAKSASFVAERSGLAGRLAVLAAVYFSAAFLFFSNLPRNSRQSDFISYDLGRNILQVMEDKAYYLSEHDMYYMPVLYSLKIERKKPDVKFYSLPALQYEWGIRQARDIFGFFPAKPGDVLYNTAGITGIAIRDAGAIYRDFTSPAFDSLRLPLYQGNAGLVKRLSSDPYHDSPAIYDLFSFRGIYSEFAKNEENTEIITRYLIFISMHAEKLQLLKRHRESIALYKKALRIPVEKLAYNIYYRLALSYDALGEYENALKMLDLALSDKPDFKEAADLAGVIRNRLISSK